MVEKVNVVVVLAAVFVLDEVGETIAQLPVWAGREAVAEPEIQVGVAWREQARQAGHDRESRISSRL